MIDAMEISLLNSNVVCLSAMPPPAFDFAALEERAELGRPRSFAQNDAIAAAQYPSIEVVALPGRLQVGFTPDLDVERAVAVAGAALEQAVPFRPSAGGTNSEYEVLIVGEEDPLGGLLDVSAAASRLGTGVDRAGLKLVFTRAPADRSTFDCEPDLVHASRWVFRSNHHYDWRPGAEELMLQGLRDPRAEPQLIRALLTADGSVE